MCDGLAMLRALSDGGVYAQLEARGAQLEQALRAVPGLIVQRFGSIFWFSLACSREPSGVPIRSPAGFPPGCAQRYAAIYHPLLARGIYLAPSGFEVGFISSAHTSADIIELASAISAVCTDLPD